MKNIKTIICLFLSILFFTSCKSKQESNQKINTIFTELINLKKLFRQIKISMLTL